MPVRPLQRYLDAAALYARFVRRYRRLGGLPPAMAPLLEHLVYLVGVATDEYCAALQSGAETAKPGDRQKLLAVLAEMDQVGAIHHALLTG
jgi:hypothetical protein